MKYITVTVSLTVDVPDEVRPEDVCLDLTQALADIHVCRRSGSDEYDLPEACVVDYDVVEAKGNECS
jgi:hypothetical protein